VLAGCALAMIALVTINAASQEKRIPGGNQAITELWLGGDVNLGDGGHKQLDLLAGMVKGATGIINLEGSVAQKSELARGGLKLWNSPAALAELHRLNVRVAGIANNHSGDAGPGAAARTALRLRQATLIPAGLQASPAYLTLAGTRIVITAHDLTAGVPDRLAEQLHDAKLKGDLLIATFHVTGPPSYLPRPELRKAVEIALAQGAAVIAAHGTHAIGPVERRGNAIIAWGLGNVAFACDCTHESEAVILRVALQSGQIKDAVVIPIEAGLNGSAAKPSKDPSGIFDLLEAIGSSHLTRNQISARF
jgi:poly-gamma-glutamate capsule biosynthesis protein CapA/YwtB (metallophosphatase superfamily)